MGESTVNTTNAAGQEPAKQSVFQRLYTGTGAFDIVGHRRKWFLAFGALVLVCFVSMGLKGFNFGIAFEGGTDQLPRAERHDHHRGGTVFSDTLRRNPPRPNRSAPVTATIRSENSAGRGGPIKQALFTELQPLGTAASPVSGPSATVGSVPRGVVRSPGRH